MVWFHFFVLPTDKYKIDLYHINYLPFNFLTLTCKTILFFVFTSISSLGNVLIAWLCDWIFFFFKFSNLHDVILFHCRIYNRLYRTIWLQINWETFNLESFLILVCIWLIELLFWAITEIFGFIMYTAFHKILISSFSPIHFSK